MSEIFYRGVFAFSQTLLYAFVICVIFWIAIWFVRRDYFKDTKGQIAWKMARDAILIEYIMVVLYLTGVFGGLSDVTFELGSLAQFIKIPFVGASMKMLFLNFLLFVPYGFLLELRLQKKKHCIAISILVGFLSSLSIEMFQLFTGRLCEIDDVLINTMGFVFGFMICYFFIVFVRKGFQKKQVLFLILTTVIYGLLFLGIYLVADGDQREAMEYEYYSGFFNALEKGYVSEFYLYDSKGKTDCINSGHMDYDEELDLDGYSNCYSCMAIDIGNRANGYHIENISGETSESLIADGKRYFEIVYSEPQTFHFANNELMDIVGVIQVLYCLDDGMFWYGTESGYYSCQCTYVELEHPFELDESIEEILSAY